MVGIGIMSGMMVIVLMTLNAFIAENENSVPTKMFTFSMGCLIVALVMYEFGRQSAFKLVGVKEVTQTVTRIEPVVHVCGCVPCQQARARGEAK